MYTDFAYRNTLRMYIGQAIMPCLSLEEGRLQEQFLQFQLRGKGVQSGYQCIHLAIRPTLPVHSCCMARSSKKSCGGHCVVEILAVRCVHVCHHKHTNWVSMDNNT